MKQYFVSQRKVCLSVSLIVQYSAHAHVVWKLFLRRQSGAFAKANVLLTAGVAHNMVFKPGG